MCSAVLGNKVFLYHTNICDEKVIRTLNRQTVDLGLIMRHFDVDFSMSTFDERLRLQKFIYLLQTFGIYLGYDFSWHIRGPYCSTLATNGFALREIYNKIPSNKVRFENPSVQKKFKKFQDFIKNRMADEQFLEIAASLHNLNATKISKDVDLVQTLMNRKPGRFREEQCREILEELKKWDLL